MIQTKSNTIYNRLNNQLGLYAQKQFTGRLDVKIFNKQWNFYFRLGRFVWATGGEHSMRRWYRQLSYCCPKVKSDSITLEKNDDFECWDYQALTFLVYKRLARTDEIMAVIQGVIGEVLFDLFQALDIASLKIEEQKIFSNVSSHLGASPCHGKSSCILPRTWTLEIEPMFTQVQQDWKQWEKLGLRRFSPNLVPYIKESEQLQKKTSEKVYNNLVTIINGKQTLRDISVLVGRDLFTLTRSLLPYIKQKWIGLKKISDRPGPSWAKEAVKSRSSGKASIKKRVNSSRTNLIAYIDDSPQACAAMRKLLTQCGYQSVTIQNSVQALPHLIKRKPDLIFLDLIMPIANGYEICSQIRRVSSLQEIPVIILTSNDGIVDRVRAKMVGASDFISKPIDSEKLQGILEKYLMSEKSENDP